jgi:hypothetical protein
MNYYPNFFTNSYSYNGNNNGQYIPQAQAYPPVIQQPPQLNGKMVDSVEVVKATEVPIGGYGIFPKADLTEIYIKSWNNNGTTSVITFVPAQPIVATETQQAENTVMEEILNKIKDLEVKIDGLSVPNKITTTETNKKKEFII